MNPEVASDKTFLTANEWIQRCIEEHPRCPVPNLSLLPTRVLDVGCAFDGSERVKIHVAADTRGHYVALSYCWGMPRQPVETTKATLHSYIHSGITTSSLPPTIEDAVQVTRKLGIRYLWVDSLCIVQDDREDKTREISQMRRIYSNAYCTISAANVSKVIESFLQARPTHGSHVFTLPYICPDGKIGTMTLGQDVKLRDNPGWSVMQFYDPYAEPINRRAWTLEEKLLSPRILIYAAKSLRWLCDSDEWSDGGNPDARFDTQAERLPYRMQVSTEIGTTILDDKRLQSLWERWRYILEDYTNRHLTKAKDKLRAISGLADYFHKLTSDQYLAGLWRGDLLNELVWVRSKEAQLRPPQNAPSWSWASVSGPVYFLGLHEQREFYHCSILECATTPLSTLAPFGDVTIGTMKIRGLVKDIPWDADGEALLGADMKRIGSAILDVKEDQPQYATICCLAVSALRRDGDAGGFYPPCGLILSPIDDRPDHFVRIGAFVTSDPLVFENAEQRTLTIV